MVAKYRMQYEMLKLSSRYADIAGTQAATPNPTVRVTIHCSRGDASNNMLGHKLHAVELRSLSLVGYGV